jgi:DNA invertase Pin-like site-specific DNA recombinase
VTTILKNAASQGIAKGRATGAYKGRPENTGRNDGIAKMLASGMTYSEIHKSTGAVRATIARIKARETCYSLSNYYDHIYPDMILLILPE